MNLSEAFRKFETAGVEAMYAMREFAAALRALDKRRRRREHRRTARFLKHSARIARNQEELKARARWHLEQARRLGR